MITVVVDCVLLLATVECVVLVAIVLSALSLLLLIVVGVAYRWTDDRSRDVASVCRT